MVFYDLNVDDIVKRYQSGESMDNIGESLGVTRSVIVFRLRGAGVMIRNGHESMLVRMARTPPEIRSRNAIAAHAAVRGKRRTEKELLQRASTKEGDLRFASRIEIICKNMLEERGFTCISQKAIGTYNVDVAITEPPIAVEIFGGNWHSFGRHAARHRKRFDYILNAGWTVVIIWVVRDYPLESGAIDYIISLTENIRGGEAVISKEHVIRGDGHLSSLGKMHLDHHTIIPNSES